ncbi:MAG TPA: class I adenylate-forming enzyme family protein [Steroidobacter sp.]|uniref:class I adenylate-forming enzyme family protein n=1 Tax=Steroidobacter sp. TaxID=1978227 RepID=UPI002ED8EF2D
MTTSLVHDFDACARQTPDAPALSWHGGVWTYAELRRAVGCAQGMLVRSGITPGSRVALFVRNSPQYVASYFGVMAAGCVAVPLNVQERATVLSRQIEHADCRVVIADPQHPEWGALSAAISNIVSLIVTVDLQPGSAGCDQFCSAMGEAQPELRDLATAAPAMMIYTSGTTARPKGVVLSNGNLVANARTIAAYLKIDRSDKVLCGLPFHFSYGSSVLNSNLIAGAQLLLEDNFAFPQQTLRRMQDERVTGFPGVPSTFALLLGRCQLSDFDLSHLRYITQAGGSMPRAQIEKLRQQLPHTQVFIMYGQTEATARLSYLDPTELERKLGSVGKPLAGVEIQVRAEGRVLPAGEVGEICARGPNVMLGYWRQPELSAQVLQEGWLHTGDLGHFDDEGFLYIDGRAVDMIKVGAFRVSPQEVEEVLATFPGVQEVAVAGIPDPVLGQAIKAVIVLREGVPADLMGVKAHCRQHLANYKVPKTVEFAAALPRTASGKVQRFKLAQLN